MEIVLVIVGVIVVWWLYMNSKAKRIARRHAETLAKKTGKSPESIYREMRDNRLTPGEWASMHGLDAMTFEPSGTTPDVGNHFSGSRGQKLTGPRGERSIRNPDWDDVADHLSDDEVEVDTCKGWTVGGDVDHPCAVFLTDRAVYVRVRPDTLAPDETISIPFQNVGKCGVMPSDQGTPRLVIVFDSAENRREEDIQGVAVDLRPPDRGWEFGKRVTAACEGS